MICVVVVVVRIEWNGYVTFECRRVIKYVAYVRTVEISKSRLKDCTVGHWGGINGNGATGVLLVHETITKERH